MSRRHFAFDCLGSTLAATLDDAPGVAGLLIVTGGNETRAGAFASQANLAALIAATGHPVLRFDRRGVGDSEGVNMGFRHSAEDIAAALAAFRAQCPRVRRVVAFGNCDAASALMLMGGAGFQGLVLSNPWTYEDDQADAQPPPSAIRARYAAKLWNPRELLRLLTGKVSLAKLAGDFSAQRRDRRPAAWLGRWRRASPVSLAPSASSSRSATGPGRPSSPDGMRTILACAAVRVPITLIPTTGRASGWSTRFLQR